MHDAETTDYREAGGEEGFRGDARSVERLTRGAGPAPDRPQTCFRAIGCSPDALPRFTDLAARHTGIGELLGVALVVHVLGVGCGTASTGRSAFRSTAADHDGILADPEPTVRVTDIGDSAVLLRPRFRISDPDHEEFSATRSERIREVKERCERAGIDPSTTSQHDLSGTIAVEDAAPG